MLKLIETGQVNNKARFDIGVSVNLGFPFIELQIMFGNVMSISILQKGE